MDHYFNYLPKIQDYERIFHHPHYPFSSTAFGALIPDDGYVFSAKSETNFGLRKENGEEVIQRLPLRVRLVWECYNGITINEKRVHYLNGNPLDFSYGNLVTQDQVDREKIREAVAKKEQFYKATAQHMLEVDKKLQNRNIDPSYYWELVSVPKRIMKYYTKLKGISVKEKCTGPSYQLRNNIYELYHSGYTVKQIKQKLNVTAQTVYYWVKRIPKQV